MKTALITGASSGFGKAIAESLAKENFNLILVARRAEKLDEVKKELKKLTSVYAEVLDVRNEEAIKNLFKDLPKEFQNIDLLVNNAGLARGFDIAQNCELCDWEEMVQTNIQGLLNFTNYTLKIMAKNNSGHIINIGSVAGHAPYKGGNVYGATKAFVKQFSKNLRADLLGTKIKVTNIEPGMAETEFSEVRFKGDKLKAKDIYKGMKPLKAEDIAEAILWIIKRPEYVNIDNIEIMPIDQTYGTLAINRKNT